MSIGEVGKSKQKNPRSGKRLPERGWGILHQMIVQVGISLSLGKIFCHGLVDDGGKLTDFCGIEIVVGAVGDDTDDIGIAL